MAWSFGIGQLVLVPPSNAADPSVLQAGELSDLTINFDSDLKELAGGKRLPVDATYGKLKITGKAKYARIHGGIVAATLPGATIATGTTVGVLDEMALSVSSITQVQNHVGFAEDLGVVDRTAKVTLTKVTTTPTTGQYNVDSTGTYTWATTDATHNMAISYSYTVTTGHTITVNNTLMGGATQYGLRVFQRKGGLNGFKFGAVYVPKLDFAFKSEDYLEQNLDFTIGADYATDKAVEAYLDD